MLFHWSISSLLCAGASALDLGDETSSLLQLKKTGDGVNCITGKCRTTTTTTCDDTTTTTTAEFLIVTTTPKCNGESVCSAFQCPETYSLRDNADDLCGADRATCCIKDGVCSGQPIGSACSLADIDTSLIPNPSFESRTGCPTSFSQLNKANKWHQATGATSDFIVEGGGCAHWTAFTGPSAPDGDAMVGAIGMPNWVEYVGACLTSPLEAGKTYTMTMSAAAALVSNAYGGNTNGNTELLCIPHCSFPLGGTGYMGNTYPVLARASPGGGLQYGGRNSQWKALTFEFTPTQNCPAVMFGPAQDSSIQPGKQGSYTVFDGLNLQAGFAGHCDAEGHCS